VKEGKAMKIMSVATMAVLVGVGVCDGAIPQQDARRVTVCTARVASPVAFYQARTIASKMYAEIGVKIDWRSRGASCTAVDAVIIEFTENTPAALLPGSLACALPYERIHIRVFLDRVKETVGPAAMPYVLAHVLVHEIGHLLQGINRHSETGVMKAQWDVDDYKRMVASPLPFTEEDVRLIHDGLEGAAAQLRQ
jgi:hypothetical protein